MSTGGFRIKLPECHSGVSDVGAGTNCEVGEAADEALVINEDIVVADIGD